MRAAAVRGRDARHAGEPGRRAHRAARGRSWTPPGETVRDKHYDKTLGGVDWNAVRAKYEPLALAAPSDAAFYRVANQMIGELGQSHMLIVGPGAEEDDDVEQMAPPGETPAGTPPAPAGTPPAPAAQPPGTPAAVAKDGVGDPGLTVRVIDGRPTITRVRAGSAGRSRRPGPGIRGHADRGPAAGRAARLRAAAAPGRGAVRHRRAAQRRLQGPPGTRVSIAYLDDRDRPGNAVLVRDPPRSEPVRLGHLPPLYPEVRAYEIGNVGVIGFNVFLLQPILEEVKRAMARFVRTACAPSCWTCAATRAARGDGDSDRVPVRHPAGDAGDDALPRVQPDVQGAARDGRGAVHRAVAILTDEGSASAAEILAAGLQEAKRAIVVGDTTLGAVLPSVIEALPGGAVMQYVVADFKTPKGVALEGRGVQPDRRVARRARRCAAAATRCSTRRWWR